MAVTSTGPNTPSGTESADQQEIFKALFFDLSATDGLTALAGGAQAGTLLGYQTNRFTTVASSADSAQLPAAVPGRWRVVTNAAASNALAVFPATGETINALSANASFSVAANKTALFFCMVAGVWNTILTA